MNRWETNLKMKLFKNKATKHCKKPRTFKLEMNECIFGEGLVLRQDTEVIICDVEQLKQIKNRINKFFRQKRLDNKN